MKDFFKFMFASMVGFFLTFIILFLLLIGFIMAMVSFTQKEDVVVNEKTILQLKLNYPIDDRTSRDPLNYTFNLESFKVNLGLNDILSNIQKAGKDDRIAGIYLDLQEMPSGLTILSEIRKSLNEFKQTGKFVYVYGTILSQKAYYLGSVADKIYLNPKGLVDFRGFNGEVVFLKGLLDKLDIEPQIIRHGKYKSAIEPFILDKMSEANKEQTLAYIKALWDNSVAEISVSRNIPVEKLNEAADKLWTANSRNALELHFVDSLIYFDEFLSILAKHLNIENVKQENLISLNKYNLASVDKEGSKRSKNKVAVVYALGTIIQGEGDDGIIGSDKISRTIRQARLDNAVKAVVLRVNSPGGDALASDIILREVNLTRQVKPVVVSMGDVAASGGYYIACGADKIVAYPNTITGSIGVFGMIPNLENMFKNKLGITFDGVKTNENSDFMQLTKPLAEYQYEVIKQEIEEIYTTFINHVAEGRNMTPEQVDEIAQGRVWSGIDAVSLGLVDELGGLDDAVKIAANLAQLEDYRTIELPAQKDPFTQIMEDFFGETKMNILQNELGTQYKYFEYLKEISTLKGVQARLPYKIEIN